MDPRGEATHTRTWAQQPLDSHVHRRHGARRASGLLTACRGHYAPAQATATETIEVEARVLPDKNSSNGNGNGAHHADASANGNGAVPSPPRIVPSKAAVEVATAVAAATVVTNAANAAANGASSSNGNGASSNGNGASSSNGNGTAASAKAKSPSPPPSSFKALSTQSLDEALDPQAAGQVETVAATGGATRVNRTAAGTPYANPGGRWSKFKSYSTFQVRGGALGMPAVRAPQGA